MADLTAALDARTLKSLSKQYRFDGVVMTLKEYIDTNATGFSIKDVPKYEYNRRKFNNMDYREQAIYEEKLKQRKTSYRAEFADGSILEIPKLVYEFYTEGNK